MRNSNVLVTGGSGFLGKHFVKCLVDKGRNVKILDIKDCENNNVEFVKGDIRDYETVRKCVKDVDVVFNLASLVPQSNVKKETYDQIIVNGTRNVIDACKDTSVKVIHVSSSSVYGLNRGKNPLKEDDPKKPVAAYGASKLSAEHLFTANSDKVNSTMLRPMTIVGPGIYGLFKMFLGFVKRSYPLMIFGNGNNRIQMVSLSDTADALLLAEKREKSGEMFNLGSKDVPTFRNQIEALIKHANSKSVVISIPPSLGRGIFRFLHMIHLSPLMPEHYYTLDKDSILDISETEKILKWTPKKNNIQMTIEAYDWYTGKIESKT